MSSRKISSESFSSVGSDCPESPDDSECPFSRALWNGRSPVDTLSSPFEEAMPVKRATRRRRVNLDSLGESLRRLTWPTRQSNAVELDMLRKLVAQPQTEYPYAGPSVPGFPRIVLHFGAFQESVVRFELEVEERVLTEPFICPSDPLGLNKSKI
ncbi:guanylate cyclase soluble subunit alpha-2-like [Arapaima gigas]